MFTNLANELGHHPFFECHFDHFRSKIAEDRALKPEEAFRLSCAGRRAEVQPRIWPTGRGIDVPTIGDFFVSPKQPYLLEKFDPQYIQYLGDVKHWDIYQPLTDGVF